MRKDFGAKTWLFPMPVLILGAYGTNGDPMAMNAAWGGIGAEHTVVMCIDSGHKTTEYILQSKAFTVSPATADQLVACDYVALSPAMMYRTRWSVPDSIPIKPSM